MSERLTYIDKVLSTYLWAKDHLSSNTLYLQIFAIGHAKDVRNVLRPTDDDSSGMKPKEESSIEKIEEENPEVLNEQASAEVLKVPEEKPKFKIEEQTEVHLSKVLPSGCKVNYINNQMAQNYLMTKKESLLRTYIADCDFPLFEDDMIEYKIYNGSEVYATGFGNFNELNINIKELREKFKIRQNSLIELDLRVAKYGKIREYLEEISYCKDDTSTFAYLDYLTSSDKIKAELFDLLNEGHLDKLDERLKVYNLSKPEHQSWNEQYLTILCESLPKNFYFPDQDGIDMLEDILDVAGIIENTGANFTNKHLLSGMNYKEANIRCDMLKEYIITRTK